MPEELRAHEVGTLTPRGTYPMDPHEEGQCAPRSRPVSFYDNFKDVPAMPPCVTTAMSVGNLSEVRENGASSATTPGNRVSSAVSAGNVARIHNVKVTGAVSTGNIGKMFRPEKEKELGRAPSMANCLSTTVPVNLAASQIAGRHTPTRNSLRHSRMIVMNRTGNVGSAAQKGPLPEGTEANAGRSSSRNTSQWRSLLGKESRDAVPRKSQTPLLRHRKLARCLAVMQTVLGVAVTSLSLWLLLWSPNLPLTDNPYWSGMPLLLSGSFGICLLCCFKKEYPGMSPGFCLSATKVVSVFLSTLASAACIIACVASAMHLARLTGLECTPPRVLNATCVCRPRGDFSNPSQSFLRYEDLNCPDVENILTILLIFSSTCNGLGAIVAGWYCYLHWSTREKRPKYMQVRTNPNSGNSILSRPIYNPNLNGR